LILYHVTYLIENSQRKFHISKTEKGPAQGISIKLRRQWEEKLRKTLEHANPKEMPKVTCQSYSPILEEENLEED
jgi:hypothetical protein